MAEPTDPPSRAGWSASVSTRVKLGSPAAAAPAVTGAEISQWLREAVSHHQQGRLAEADRLYRQILAYDPNHPHALDLLGLLASQLGHHDMAVQLISRAIEIDGRFARFHSDLAGVLLAQGRLEEATASGRRAVEMQPDNAAAQANLGKLLLDMGQVDEAIAACNRAIALQPDLGEAYNNLGVALQYKEQYEEAIEVLRRGIAVQPGAANLHVNHGLALHSLERFHESETALRRAIELDPLQTEAYNGLGGALMNLNRIDEAAVAFGRAVETRPDHHDADSNRLICLNYSRDLSGETMLAEHRAWAARHAAVVAAPSFANVRDPERRLRVGYVSADLRAHPVGYFMLNVLTAHDRSAVEAFCYSNTLFEDDLTQKLRAVAGPWRSVAGVSDEAVVEMIRKDEIDILIDLAGHTGNSRLKLFSRRPAPVQASWLGYPGTTGLSSMDYLLMDAITVPGGAEQWCSEAVVRLPYGRFCYAPPVYAPEVDLPVSRPVVFGSFNNLIKVGPDVVRLWTEVLKATPGSRLVLKWKSLEGADTRGRLARAFAEAGLEPERLELRGPSPHAEMLAEYGDIDIALDPFPFCGGLTSCEALWMGVPVVTLPGDRPASRQTLGFLNVLGLDDEFAARSEADYVRIATELAADPERRSELRRSLRPHMASSPLCDGALFTTGLETALRQMWRRWCAGEPAVTFDVPPVPERRGRGH